MKAHGVSGKALIANMLGFRNEWECELIVADLKDDIDCCRCYGLKFDEEVIMESGATHQRHNVSK